MNKYYSVIFFFVILIQISCEKRPSSRYNIQHDKPFEENDQIRTSSSLEYEIIKGQKFDTDINKIIDLHIEKTGKKKFKEASTLVYKGSLNQSGIISKFVFYTKNKDKLRYEWYYMGELNFSIINDKDSYKYNLFKYPVDSGEMSNTEIQRVLSKANIGQMLFNRKEHGNIFDTVYLAKLNNDVTYAIIRKENNHMEHIYFIDMDNYNLLKYAIVDKKLEDHIIYTINFSNYVVRQGISVPLRIEYYSHGQLFEKYIIDFIEFNSDINDTLFNIPNK